MLENRRSGDTEYCIVHEHCMNSANGKSSPTPSAANSAARGLVQLFFRHICILAVIIVGFIFVLLMLPVSLPHGKIPSRLQMGGGQPEVTCRIRLVESIPQGLTYPEGSPQFMSTFEAWQRLLDIATATVDIGSLYWTLLGAEVCNDTATAWEGEHIYHRILNNSIDHKLAIRIAQSQSSDNYPDTDTKTFQMYGAASVRTVDFNQLLGGGVLHTKLWIVDQKHFYLGSANMDWRSLTQVKEMGVLAEDCPSLATDMQKIFDAYWYLGKDHATVPGSWGWHYHTDYNWASPLLVNFNGSFKANALLTSSPPPLLADGRENDADAIVKAILGAQEFVHIAVMDYFPLMLYSAKTSYWAVIDDAIRKAAIENKVAVRMLISWWPHSRPSEDYFLKSLTSLSSAMEGVSIEVRRFVVPSSEEQAKIPFARVNHNKYMVTDNTAYIGTSNWSGDYFVNTAGVALVTRDLIDSNNTLRQDLASVFQRDWESPYAAAFH